MATDKEKVESLFNDLDIRIDFLESSTEIEIEINNNEEIETVRGDPWAGC